MNKIFFIVLFLSFWSNIVSSDEIELSLNDELIDIRVKADYGSDFFGPLAYMRSDSDGIDTDLLSYTFATQGMVDRYNVILGLRPFWIDTEDGEGFGAAVGAGGNMELATNIIVSAEFFYAPKIITGGDIDDSLDMELRIGYQIIENGSIYVGYRELDVDVEDGDNIDIYDDFFVGINLRF